MQLSMCTIKVKSNLLLMSGATPIRDNTVKVIMIEIYKSTVHTRIKIRSIETSHRCIISNSLYGYMHLALSGTGLDEQNIAILDDVILALGHDLTGSLNSSFVTELTQGAVVVGNGLNEGLLEVGVDNTGGGRGLDTLTDSPLTDLISTSSEETGQVEGSTHGGDGLGQTGLGTELLALLSSSSVIAHQSETLLEAGGDGQNGAAGGVGLAPLEQTREVLVLLTNVVTLAQVDQVHDGLGSEQEKRVDDLDLEPFMLARLR